MSSSFVGIDSRYFDQQSPPEDVTCVDLDTNMVTQYVVVSLFCVNSVTFAIIATGVIMLFFAVFFIMSFFHFYFFVIVCCCCFLGDIAFTIIVAI